MVFTTMRNPFFVTELDRRSQENAIRGSAGRTAAMGVETSAFSGRPARAGLAASAVALTDEARGALRRRSRGLAGAEAVR